MEFQNTMHEDRKESKHSNSKLIVATITFTIIVGALLIAIISPISLIGYIWDWDIDQQLDNANKLAIQNSIDEMSLRLTYETGEENDLRVQRAVDVFHNKFGIENTYEIERLEDKTIIVFTWETYYEKSLLEQREIQLEEFYDGN